MHIAQQLHQHLFSGVYRVQHKSNFVRKLNSRLLNWLILFGRPTIRGEEASTPLLDGHALVTNFERHILFMSYSNE